MDPLLPLQELYEKWWISDVVSPFWKRLTNSNLGNIDLTIREFTTLYGITDPNVLLEIQSAIAFFKFYFLYLQEIFPAWTNSKNPRELFQNKMRVVLADYGTRAYITEGEGTSRFLIDCITEINAEVTTTLGNGIDFGHISNGFWLWISLALFYKTPFYIQYGVVDCIGVERRDDTGDDCNETNPPFLSSISESNRETYISHIKNMYLDTNISNALKYIRYILNGHNIDGTVIKILLSENIEKIVKDITNLFKRHDVIRKPFETSDLCIKRGTSDTVIYMLRLQVHQGIMDIISRDYEPVLKAIRQIVGLPGITLTRIGYFNIEYTKDNPTCRISKITDIPTAMASVGAANIIQLNNEQFNILFRDFGDFFYALFNKTVIEQLFRQGEPDSFNINIAIDLYPNRSLGESQHLFHRDATEHCPTTFFTLTYLVKNNDTEMYDPSILIKGPTVVTATEQITDRTQATLAVRHGTTIGIDNTLVLHATSDAIVRLPTLCTSETIEAAISRHPEFRYKTQPKQEYPDATTIAMQERVEQCTRDTTRSFVRTWFIPDFPNDTLRLFDEIFINMEHLIDIYNQLRGIIFSTMEDEPNVVLSMLSKISLGGQKGGMCLIDINKNKESKDFFNKIAASNENLIIGSLHTTGGFMKNKNKNKNKKSCKSKNSSKNKNKNKKSCKSKSKNKIKNTKKRRF